MAEDMTQNTLPRRIPTGAKPSATDRIEAMLVRQMEIINEAVLKVSGYFAGATTADRLDLHERQLNRLARTFALQADTLKRLRGTGEQTIVVMNVAGQAIVGNVSQRAGTTAQNMPQETRALPNAPGVAMPIIPVEAASTVPINQNGITDNG